MPRGKSEPITKLYHGTTESIAKLACAKGLYSYDLNLFGQNINPASNGCINLTSVYAGMMALNASDRGRWGIIEIDALKLDPERLVPSDIYILDKAKSYPKTEKDYAEQLAKVQQKLLVYKAGILRQIRCMWVFCKYPGRCYYESYDLRPWL